ncbi:MAG: hypothetical protein QXH55_02625 [Candidatus Korarchaeota archaeon]|nr:hypothetical protein [Thermoproteota archaeon]
MSGRVKRVCMVTIIFLLLLALSPTGSMCESVLFKPDSYFEWSIALWRYLKGVQVGIRALKELLWEGSLRLEIITVKPLDGKFMLEYKYVMNYTHVVKSKYTAQDTSDRIQQGIGESSYATVEFSSTDYRYLLGNLKWGFNASFPVTPLLFLNSPRSGFTVWLKDFMTIQFGLVKKECGIIYSSWDIVLGTYRDVYYVEMFLPAKYLNTTENIVVEASMVEIDFTIDKEYGFVGYLRIYWEYSATESFEILARITDTKIIPHNIFYYTVASVIAAMIAIAYTYKFYRGKRRLRLVRV